MARFSSIASISLLCDAAAAPGAPLLDDSIDSPLFVTILLVFSVTILLLVLLCFLGWLRRSVRGGSFVKYATKLSYLLIPVSITYIIGLMHSTEEPNVLYPVWSGALIYAYGGVVTVTACDLSDNEDTVRYVCGTLPLFFWTLWLGVLVYPSKKLHPGSKSMSLLELIEPTVPLFLWICAILWFLVLAFINTKQTLEAFYKASKSKGLPELVEPTMRYMRQGRDIVDMANDPLTMRGYKYVIWGNPSDTTRITTTEDIWEWIDTPAIGDEEEQQNRESLTLAYCPGRERLKDLCLSYAFFRLILRRFAGFPLHESCKPHTRRFVLEGLLHESDSERVFRVIEVELGFLFDFFYTKSHVCGSYRFRDMLQSLGHIVLLVSFVAFAIRFLTREIAQCNTLIMEYRKRKVQYTRAVDFTGVILIVFILLECSKYVMVYYSNRKMVWLLCTGRNKAIGDNKLWAWVMEKRIIWVWTIKHCISTSRLLSSLTKPWQRKLGQYSFLESYHRVPILARKIFSPLAKLVKLPRVGQDGNFSVQLSTELKQAIISSLLQNELSLSPGKSTITRLHFADEEDTTTLLNACHLETHDDVARVILVWHIATSFCEFLHPPNTEESNDQDDVNFLVSTQLSKYCAYLLTFSPGLLPDHPYTTERLFEQAVKHANELDMKGMDMRSRYNFLLELNQRDPNDDKVVVKGAMLASTLIGQVLNTPNNGWRVLAEFWSELVLYLAPSDNVGVHGEYLASGGEFITHLWALLTHAGVLTRN